MRPCPRESQSRVDSFRSRHQRGDVSMSHSTLSDQTIERNATSPGNLERAGRMFQARGPTGFVSHVPVAPLESQLVAEIGDPASGVGRVRPFLRQRPPLGQCCASDERSRLEAGNFFETFAPPTIARRRAFLCLRPGGVTSF